MLSFEIREALFPRCIEQGRLVVEEEAKRLGVRPGEISVALDSDLRFVRTAGDGHWDWKPYIYRTYEKHGRHRRAHA